LSAEEVATALEQLSEVLQSQKTLGAALAGIAEAAVRTIPGCDAGSVALSIEGRPATAAATGRVALELDLVQYDTDDGPCLTCFRNLEVLRIDLVEQGEAFPHFARAAGARGVVAVLSVPATWGGEIIATLNLYSRSGPFDDTASSMAAILAAQVAIAVSRSPEFAAARGTVEQAQRDADDRSNVDMATGMLMATQGCTAEQAEGLLRQAAGHEAKTILQIAQRILEQYATGRE
jgi:GAF domain-containing protein